MTSISLPHQTARCLIHINAMRCSEDQVRQHDGSSTGDQGDVVSNQDRCHVGELALRGLCATYDAVAEVPGHGRRSFFYGDSWSYRVT